MIIDVILDRKYWESVGVLDWYDDDQKKYLYDCAVLFEMYDIADKISLGTNKEIQQVLCKYLDEQGYNPSIKDYINSVEW